MNNKIYTIELKEKELEKQLLDIVKKDNLLDQDFSKMNEIKKELNELKKSKDQIIFEQNNWECSRIYKSVDGKTKEIFLINNKEVTKEEYLDFINKNINNENFFTLKDERKNLIFNPFFWI